MKALKLLLFTAIILSQAVQSFAQAPFITTWKTDNPGTSASDQITIPGSGTNYLIEWEEAGNPTNFGSENATDNHTITFPNSGTYIVKISGGSPAFNRIYFNNQADKEKLININQWGNTQWSSLTGAFAGCKNMTYLALDAPDLSLILDLDFTFLLCNAFNGDLSDWDVKDITSLDNTFYQCNSFNGDISNWDVSNVSSMHQTFLGAYVFNIDISSWNVSKVTSMVNLFNSCFNFNQDISNWNVSSVNNMFRMFISARSFDQDLSSWDVSNVTTMKAMFANTYLFNQNLGLWDISNVTDMTDMLYNSGLSRENYDNTLIGWQLQSVNQNVPLGATNMEYCDSETARDNLINNSAWVISGDSKNCSLLCLEVTNTNDSGPGSLREAINCANLMNNQLISFNIPGAGPHTINLLSSLPDINANGIILDATTQPGNFPMADQVVIDITNMTPVNNIITALVINGTDSEIYGLNFVNNNTSVSSTALYYFTGANNFTVGGANRGNKFLDKKWSAAIYVKENILYGSIGDNIFDSSTNQITRGIFVNSGTDSLVISNNVFSNCTISAIELNNGCFGNTIQGNNFVGNATGIYNYGNKFNGYNEGNQFLYNTFDCNALSIENTPDANNNIAAPIITLATANLIEGTASPSAIVQIYASTNTCISAPCQGEIFIDEVTADINGDFIYFSNNSFAAGISITAIQTLDPDGSSEFAICQNVIPESCYAEIDIYNDFCSPPSGDQVLNFTPNLSLILLNPLLTGPYNVKVNGNTFSNVNSYTGFGTEITMDMALVGVDINSPGTYNITLEQISNTNGSCSTNTGNIHTTSIEVVDFPSLSINYVCDQNDNLEYQVIYNGTGGVPGSYFDVEHSLDNFQQHTFQLPNPLPPPGTLVYSEVIPLNCSNTEIQSWITPNCFKYYFFQQSHVFTCGSLDPCDLDFTFFFQSDESCPNQKDGIINGEVNSACHTVSVEMYKDGTLESVFQSNYLYLTQLEPASYSFVATSVYDQSCTTTFGPFIILPGPTDDLDSDNVLDCQDNCPNDNNPNQEDTDGDRIGDACDICPNDYYNDIDGDGICGDIDNCPDLYNPDQSIIPCDFSQYASCRERDSMALVAFYTSTRGYNWINQWDLNQPMNTWYGVQMSPDDCHVEVLFSNTNKINGYLTEAIGVLDQLLVLDLYRGGLSGEIPQTIGNLTSLGFLGLADQKLTGSIPTSIGNLSNLNSMYMWGNQLSGSIPAEIGNLSNLIDLSISYNQLSGTIPTELGNLLNLEIAYLSNNKLSGSIPEIFSNLQSLRNFEVQNNNLSGPLPLGIASIPSLAVFYAWENNLEGCFPSIYLQNLCGINYSFWSNPQLPFNGDMYLMCNGLADQDVDGDQVCTPQDCDDNDDTVGADSSPPVPICSGDNGSIALYQGEGFFPIILDLVSPYDSTTQTHAQIDDCTDINSLGFMMSKDGGPYSNFAELSCADIGRIIPISYKITDNANNDAYCYFNITVTDGDNTCPCVDNLQVDMAGTFAEYKAKITVSSDAIITGNVLMHGGTSVDLDPGFEVEPNALFEAYIEGCNNN